MLFFTYIYLFIILHWPTLGNILAGNIAKKSVLILGNPTLFHTIGQNTNIILQDK